jgi:hypothetical protein
MGMQQPSPEILQQLMAQGQSPQGEDSMQADPATGSHPDAAQFSPPEIAPQQIDPMDMVQEVISAYMNYALSIVQDNTLDKPIQSKILLEQAQAMSSLVSLIHSDPAHPANQQGQDPAQVQAEMEMKAQQHEQDLKLKAAVHDQNMQVQTEKHQMELQKMQHDMQMAIAHHQLDQAKHHQDIQHKEKEHSQKLVHNEKANEAKIKQQKQAAQSKPSSKQGK